MKGIVDEGDWTGGIINWKKEVTSKHGPDITFKKRKLPGVNGKTDTYATNSEGKVVGVYQHHNDMGRVLSETDAIKGADGKRCWKGKRYAGTENGKDKCVPVKEEQIDELSPETMLKYRKKADDDANYADATGDDARFDKRVKGVMSANRLLRNKKTTEAANPVQAIKEFADDEKSEQPRREHPITIYIYSILHNKTITIVGEKLKRIPYGTYDQVHVEFTVPTSGETRTMWMPVTDKKYPTGTLSDNVYLSSSQKHNNTVTDGIFNYWAYEPNVNEGVIVGHDANDPEIAILGGAGTMSLSRLKKKAHQEALQLADDIANGKYNASSYNMKQLHNTLNTIVAAEKEMEKSYFGEDPDTSGAVGTQPGGWHRTDLDEYREMSPALKAAQQNLIALRNKEKAVNVPGKKERAPRDKVELDKPKPASVLAKGGQAPNPLMDKMMADFLARGGEIKKGRPGKAPPVGRNQASKHIGGGGKYRKKSDTPGQGANYRGAAIVAVEEDTAYASGMGQGGNAGESYRKFKPKSAGTCKESSIMKGLNSESK